jgi:hypothetical protein
LRRCQKYRDDTTDEGELSPISFKCIDVVSVIKIGMEDDEYNSEEKALKLDNLS